MEASRLFWAETILAVFLLGFAGVTGEVLPLLGGGGVIALLVGRFYAFGMAVGRVNDRLKLSHDVDRPTVRVDEPVFVSVDAKLSSPVPVDVSATVVPPLPARTPRDIDTSLNLSEGQQVTQLTFPIEIPLAGNHRFDATTITVTDPGGRFRETLSIEPGFSITVDASGPLAGALGTDHDWEQTVFAGAGGRRTRPGLEPVEVREYVPSDTLRRIDWNATARFNRPHVREFENEAERSMLLILDHRTPANVGPPGGTAFDYLRSTALSVLTGARRRGEQVTLVTVGNDGVTTNRPAGRIADAHRGLRRHLLALEVDHTTQSSWSGAHGSKWTPRRARRSSTRLATDDSAFANRLRQYFATPGNHFRALKENPLLSTVQELTTRKATPRRAVLLSVDDRREELYRTVKYLQLRRTDVSIFLAPMAAFAPEEGLGDHDVEIVDYEPYRKRLSRLTGVNVVSVGPGRLLEPVGTNSR